ncbi:hypothetical protein METBIDRAFT_9613 [Metschnikowia bicuspidata var. bicuspidata NRRL YB-4993]|uniref:BAR domain-containing protein n=1 Tax=Metschnikowia bicuspidata var. bicuspidata NRRL YB-4993 TaxID=869754 RepID=A0A1A0HH65_9ASCO|nr:hypothetical protein METBIDRAFT_9613 [Metschnikowia bicuspidata var. bicuspidata NRRL YB-4993]OBA23340.1 hypothetical protein METBIDRAFT_9613 [Metschnikowia bicuspidata var. bicuspidata NRRL YB-4993]
MSFKFPSFNLQSIQESIGKVDLESISKLIQNANPGKAVSEYSEHLKESIQPFTAKTQQLISSQLQQVQQLAASNLDANIEVSELPEDYLNLEANCDILLKLYTDLIHYTNDTYGTLSYDYPPGNSALNKIKDAHVGLMLSSKFSQLKNVSTPQEMENILLGHSAAAEAKPTADEDTAEIQVTSAQLPKTLYGQLAQIATRNGNQFAGLSDSLSFALLQISSAYIEIGSARLDQDKKVMHELNQKLVEVLNEKFIKVNELRKNMYAARLKFDLVRSQVGSEDEENEDLIAKEDDLVSATELAVLEMRKLINPLENVNLLKVFISAQKEFFDMASKRLGSLATELDKIDFQEDEE